MKERITITLDKDLIKEIDKKIDGHKIKNRSHAIELALMSSIGNNRPKKAVILAGGLGTRLRPITNEIPKQLMPIHGKSIMEHVFDLFKKYGIKDIVLCVGYKADKFKEYFGDGKKFNVNITYIIEDKPMGTAGPIRLAKEHLKDTFIVCNADELKDIDLFDMYLNHKEYGGAATIALTTVEDPSAYGVARLQGNKILEFVEKPKKEEAPSNLINSGLYIFEPEVIKYIPEGRSMLEKDVFPNLAKDGKLYGFPFSGQWFDTGTLERYEKAMKEWKDLE
jgi:mannose-1-phosphate guanylyltransferase